MGGFNPQGSAAERAITNAQSGSASPAIAQKFLAMGIGNGGAPIPKPPPIAPDFTDATVKAARAGQLNALLAGRGRRSTFLTMPPVDLGSPSIDSGAPAATGGRKTFLGQ